MLCPLLVSRRSTIVQRLEESHRREDWCGHIKMSGGQNREPSTRGPTRISSAPRRVGRRPQNLTQPDLGSISKNRMSWSSRSCCYLCRAERDSRIGTGQAVSYIRSFLSPATGSLMIKVVPCPTTLSTSITPL